MPLAAEQTVLVPPVIASAGGDYAPLLRSLDTCGGYRKQDGALPESVRN